MLEVQHGSHQTQIKMLAWLYSFLEAQRTPVSTLFPVSRSTPLLQRLNSPCRILSWIYSAVSHEGHLDVVCAPPLQGEPHPGPSGH